LIPRTSSRTELRNPPSFHSLPSPLHPSQIALPFFYAYPWLCFLILAALRREQVTRFRGPQLASRCFVASADFDTTSFLQSSFLSAFSESFFSVFFFLVDLLRSAERVSLTCAHFLAYGSRCSTSPGSSGICLFRFLSLSPSLFLVFP